jgi:hypothetical protein
MGRAMTAAASRKPIAAPIHHQARDHARPHASARVDFAEVNRAALAVFPAVLGASCPAASSTGMSMSLSILAALIVIWARSESTCEPASGQTSRQATAAAI